MELKPNENGKIINIAKYKDVQKVSRDIIINTEKDRVN